MTELSTDTLELLRHVSVATLCTQLFKRGLRNVFVQGIDRLTDPSGGNLVGPAFTMRNIPAREDLDQISAFDNPEHPQRKGIESVPPGHVLVIDCRGETRVASGGQILTTRLQVRGVAGLVSDGPVRDSGPISEMDFPVYCAGGSAPLNLIHHHAIDLNVPIGCGGVPVYPGDIVVGDDEGVAIVPRHLADEVARDAAEQEKMEAFILERIQAGAALPGTYP
nr:ribonuclease activity regulator RraA [Pseudomonadota bacterium]